MSSCVTFILNGTASTGSQEVCQVLANLFADNPFDARVLVAGSGAEIPLLVRQAIEQHTDAVVAGGGDGTVSAVASALAGTHIPLGILPLGACNRFAHDLHLHSEIEAAARTVLIGHIAQVDVGEINGRVFLNTASVGMNPAALSGGGRHPAAHPANWLAFLRTLGYTLSGRPFLHVRIRGEEQTRRTPFLLVGNEGRSVLPGRGFCRVQVNSRDLCLCLYRDLQGSELLRIAARGLFRGSPAPEEVEFVAANEFWVDSSRKYLEVTIDGEPHWMQTPLHYCIRRQALQVIVPARRARVA